MLLIRHLIAKLVLNHSLRSDNIFSNEKNISKNLVITCVDHLKSKKIEAYHNQLKIEIDWFDMPSYLNIRFNKVYYSSSPYY